MNERKSASALLSGAETKGQRLYPDAAANVRLAAESGGEARMRAENEGEEEESEGIREICCKEEI